MSPRSDELMALARRRTAQSRAELDAGFPDGAVSSAYYAALSAARALLSELGHNPRTHRGVWGKFRQELVQGGGFPENVFAEGPRMQNLRWAADYEGEEFSDDDARAAIGAAERFVAEAERVGEAGSSA